jgi:hypothetical protein
MEISGGPSLPFPRYIEGGWPGAPKEIVHASNQRGAAAGGPGDEPAADQPEPEDRPLDGPRLPGPGRAGLAQLALPPGRDEAELEARLFPRPMRPGSRPEPDWLAVHRELKRGKHVSLALVWLEYREVHRDGLGYSQFCERYGRWRGPGERDAIERSGWGAAVRGASAAIPCPWSTDGRARSGRLRSSWPRLASAAASTSRPSPARTWRPGGWPHPCPRVDGGGAGDPRAGQSEGGVKRACCYDPDLNPSYLEASFGPVVLPTRPRPPRDKAAVLVTERWVLAPLNTAIREETAKVNNCPFRSLKVSRNDLFEEERKGLLPLTVGRYEFASGKEAKATIDDHVEFDGNLYAVPY